MPQFRTPTLFARLTGSHKSRLICLLVWFCLLMSLAGDGLAQGRRKRRKPARKPARVAPVAKPAPTTAAPATPASNAKPTRKPPRTSTECPPVAPCLPPDVKESDIVTYGINGARNVTVGDKLRELKACCRNGRLVGPDNKEIRFFRLVCWGNPPPDYQEIQAEQTRKLNELKAQYTVIVIGCDPHTP